MKIALLSIVAVAGLAAGPLLAHDPPEGDRDGSTEPPAGLASVLEACGLPGPVGLELAVGRGRGRDVLLRELARGGAAAELALFELGVQATRADLFLLCDEIRRPGRRGQAAVIALGLSRLPGAPARLRALLENQLSGRQLAGEVDRAVPCGLRAAAAVALGLTAHPVAFQTLRDALADEERLPGAVRDAVVLGLAFSETPEDRSRVEVRLELLAEAAPLRRAAAVAAGWRGAGGAEFPKGGRPVAGLVPAGSGLR